VSFAILQPAEKVQERPPEGLFVTGPEPNDANGFELIRDLVARLVRGHDGFFKSSPLGT